MLLLLLLSVFTGIREALTDSPQNYEKISNKKASENETLSILALSGILLPTQSIENENTNKNIKISDITTQMKVRILEDDNIDLVKEAEHINDPRNLTKRKGNRKKKSELNDEFEHFLSEVDNEGLVDGAIDRSLPIFGTVSRTETISTASSQQKSIIDLYEGINDEHTKSPTRSTAIDENSTKGKRKHNSSDDDDDDKNSSTSLPKHHDRKKAKEYIEDDVKADTLDDAVASDIVKTAKMKFESMKAKYDEDEKEKPILIPILPAQDTSRLPNIPSRYTKTYYDIVAATTEMREGSMTSLWYLDGGQSDTVRTYQSNINPYSSSDTYTEKHGDKYYHEIDRSRADQEISGTDTDNKSNNETITSPSKHNENEETSRTERNEVTKTTATLADDEVENIDEHETTTESVGNYKPKVINVIEHYDEIDDEDDSNEEDDENYLTTRTVRTTTVLDDNLIEKEVITIRTMKPIIRIHPVKKPFGFVRHKQPYNFHTFSKQINRAKMYMKTEVPQIPFDEVFTESISKKYKSNLNKNLDNNKNTVPKYNEHKYRIDQSLKVNHYTNTPKASISKNTEFEKKVGNNVANNVKTTLKPQKTKPEPKTINKKGNVLSYTGRKVKIPSIRKDKIKKDRLLPLTTTVSTSTTSKLTTSKSTSSKLTTSKSTTSKSTTSKPTTSKFPTLKSTTSKLTTKQFDDKTTQYILSFKETFGPGKGMKNTKNTVMTGTTAISRTKIDGNAKYNENSNTKFNTPADYDKLYHEIVRSDDNHEETNYYDSNKATVTQKLKHTIATVFNPLLNHTDEENKYPTTTVKLTQNKKLDNITSNEPNNSNTTTLTKLKASMQKILSWELPKDLFAANSPTNDLDHNEEITIFDYKTKKTPIVNTSNDTMEYTYDKTANLPWYRHKQSNKNMSYNVLPLQKDINIENLDHTVQLQAYTFRTGSIFTNIAPTGTSVVLPTSRTTLESPNKILNFYDVTQHLATESFNVEEHKYLTSDKQPSQHNNVTNSGGNEDFDVNENETFENEPIYTQEPVRIAITYKNKTSKASSDINVTDAVTTSSTMKLGRAKPKSMTDRVLNALLKLNPIPKSQESSKILDGETYFNKSLSLYRTLVQITLDVLDKSHLINNNTWYKNVIDNTTIYQNKDQMEESDDDITDLIFSETFLKGVFSPSNLYQITNVTLPPKTAHLNSNLGENIGIQSDVDPDGVGAFDNEPIFSDPEMYEYNAKAKSLIETILNVILKNSYNHSFEEKPPMRGKRLKNISPLYKNVVNKILSIFNNKTKNEAFSLNKHYSNKTTYTTSTSRIATTENVLKKEVNTGTSTTYKIDISLDRTTFEEVLPLAVDFTGSLDNVANEKNPITILQETQSYKGLNLFEENTMRSSFQQSIVTVHNKQSDLYASSTATKAYPIVTVSAKNTITPITYSPETNEYITTSTNEITSINSKQYIGTLGETNVITKEDATSYNIMDKDITIHDTNKYTTHGFETGMEKQEIIDTKDKNDNKNKLFEFTIQPTLSTSSYHLNVKPIRHKEYEDIYDDDERIIITTKQTDLKNPVDVESSTKTNKKNYATGLTLIRDVLADDDKSFHYSQNNIGLNTEKAITSNNTFFNTEDTNAKAQETQFEISTQTVLTSLSIEDSESQLNNKITNIETSTITVKEKEPLSSHDTFPIESTTIIPLSPSIQPGFTFTDTSTITTRIYQQYLPILIATTNSPFDSNTSTKRKETNKLVLSNENYINMIHDDWTFGNINKILPIKNSEAIVADNSAHTSDDFIKSQNEIKKHRLSKDIDKDLDKLAETLASYVKEALPTIPPYEIGTTPHDTNQEKTIVELNPEDLSDMLYYEMPIFNDVKESNFLQSTPKSVIYNTSVVNNETLHTVLKELTKMKDLAENKYSGNSVLRDQTLQPHPIKVDPSDPDLENLLRKVLLNKNEPEPKKMDKVAIFEITHADRLQDELYPKKISIDDPDVSKALEKVLLHHKPLTNGTIDIVLPNKKYTTQQVPIKIQWTEIKNTASQDDSSKGQSHDCPKIHCFIINDLKNESKSKIDLQANPPIITYVNATDRKMDDKTFQEKPTRKPLPNQPSQQFKPLFTPEKSFFYKKPTVEYVIPNATFSKSPEYVYMNTPAINTCGIDNAPLKRVVEGSSNVETYPWLGVVLYPKGTRRLFTTVVLVTVQLVIASAWEINKLPKEDFRRCAKVILGHNCSGPRIDVLNYNYHPDFRAGFFSALAVIQIDSENWISTLRPICPPPQHFVSPQFYSMVMAEDCVSSNIQIFKMEHVPMESCRLYYRKNRLDRSRFWPRHSACGKASWGGACLWRSGTPLVVKQDHRWHLLGFGVPGPGCEAPSRFIDYSMHTYWVDLAVARIGQPAVTRVGTNRLIFRRSPNQIQRFGPCDIEEVRNAIFEDSLQVPEPTGNSRVGRQTSRVQYNLTIHESIDYKCVIFQASNLNDMRIDTQPKLEIKRNKDPSRIYSENDEDDIGFNVTIDFIDSILYKVKAYGSSSKNLKTLSYADAEKVQIVPNYFTNNTFNTKYEDNLKFLRQPFSDAKTRRYIRRKSLEKYKNSYINKFHNNLAARSRRKTIEQPNRRRAKARKNRRKDRKSYTENEATKTPARKKKKHSN